MRDPERLLDAGTDFEQSLLRGALEERPTAALTRRMAMGVGVAGTLSYASTAKALMQTWWGKATAALALGAGVAGVSVLASTEPPAQPSAQNDPAPVPAPAAPEVVQAEPAQTSESKEPAVSVDEAAPAEATVKRRPPSSAARRAGPNAAPSTLAQEVKLLDRARSLVHQGNHAAALSLLDTYRSRYPKGVLQREAQLLRERALRQR